MRKVLRLYSLFLIFCGLFCGLAFVQGKAVSDRQLIENRQGVEALHIDGLAPKVENAAYRPGKDAADLFIENVAEPAATETASADPPGAGLGMLWALLGVFVGGMALNLTPCVYPLIPVTISYFGAKSISNDAGRSSVAMHGLLYVLGLALMNSMLGVFAALSGQLLGGMLQNPATLLVVAAIMVIFALSMFDLWEFRLPVFVTGVAARNYAGYFGTLFIGLTLGIVAAPCIGPFVIGILMWVAGTGNPWLGFVVFFSLSLGMGCPLFILALLSGRLDRLPKSGEWMLWIRKAMGWVLIGMAAYFVKPVLPSVGGTVLLAAATLGAGIHLGWISAGNAESRAFKMMRKGVGAACIVIACGVIWASAVHGEGIKWQAFSDKALTEAKAAGKPIIIDFYADWCAPCREMDRLTFHNESVIEAAGRDFIMIKVDLTRSGDPAKERLARRYYVRGVPTILFLEPGGDERMELRVLEVMPPEKFLARMNELKNVASGAAQ